MVELLKSLHKNYVLVIAEKPRAAEKIAGALGKPTKYYINKVPVWVVYRDGEQYVIASAIGHMYTLYTGEKGYPTYRYRWVPRYFTDKDAKYVKAFLDVLSILARNAKAYINACDYDIEGSVIGYLVIKHLGDEKRAFRAKFSSLTKNEITKAFENLSKLDYEMIEAGICRHILDWLWGINISRALMDIYVRVFGTRKILSAGRVQTPTLAHAVNIILQRRLHIPKPFAHPVIYVKVGDTTYRLDPLEPPFTSLDDAEDYINKVKKHPQAYIENISSKIISYEPPHPFNLPDLQSEAYRILKISPYKTQKIAEDLYLETLISYPRTNSQKLSPTQDHNYILRRLALNPVYKMLIEKLLAETRGVLRPNNGPKDDPAHPAIHPTGEGNIEKLSRLHAKLYDLIVRRYIATFAPVMKVQYAEIVLNIHGRLYTLKGARFIDKGWLYYYPYISIEEKHLPLNLLSRGLHIPIVGVKLSIRYTSPPKPPSRLTLLKWMEEVEIGTEATRAEIIEILFKRNYIYSKASHIDVSDLAIALVHLLRDYVNELIDVGLTRKFEKMLSEIMIRKMSCRDIEEEAKMVINEHIKNIKMSMDRIVRDIHKYIEVTTKNSNDIITCRICRRAVHKNSLCLFHYEALSKVMEGYVFWQKFGYTWEKYLEKLSKLKPSGIYVKDICRYLLGNRGANSEIFTHFKP